MTLQERVNGDLVVAMKTKNERAKSVLRVLMGEFNRKIEKEGKILSDESVLKTIQKMINDLKVVNTPEANEEIEILSVYVPKELSENEIRIIIGGLFRENLSEHTALMNGDKSKLGFFIKLIKEVTKGAVDMKIVNNILNER